MPIPLTDEDITPNACMQQRYNPIQADIVNSQVGKWLALKVIEYSYSQSCARTVMIQQKKSGQYRLTIDYRNLNAWTEKHMNGIGGTTLAGMHDRTKGRAGGSRFSTCPKPTANSPFVPPTGTRRLSGTACGTVSYTHLTLPTICSV